MHTNYYRITAVLAFVAATGCKEGLTEPTCDRCDEMRVVTDRPEYRPGSTIAFTITNRTSTVLRYDWCSVTLASRGNADEFPIVYSPAKRCGIGAGPADVLERMVLVDPGVSLRDSVNISGAANQSQYRVHVWLLDEAGLPELGNPIVSNVFDVYPSASSSRN